MAYSGTLLSVLNPTGGFAESNIKISVCDYLAVKQGKLPLIEKVLVKHATETWDTGSLSSMLDTIFTTTGCPTSCPVIDDYYNVNHVLK